MRFRAVSMQLPLAGSRRSGHSISNVTGRLLGCAVALLYTVLAGGTSALTVEILTSIGGLPPHIVGTFEEPIQFQQSANGTYYVFDRRGHAVHTVDAGRTISRKVLDIGFEEGR